MKNVSGEIESTAPSYKVQMQGQVRPPADMIGASRASLSPEGFERLMQITSGAAPTPAQLCREVEFERQGYYTPPDITPAELARIQAEAFLIAAAKTQLSPNGFKELMHTIDWRAPTPAELVAAVEAERRKH